MKIYTKESLIASLQAIRSLGWVKNARRGNVGGVGNTLEDFLGIKENNLPIPNASEWELKCHRVASSSLTTLFHMEPSPTALKLVPSLLLPKYGWPHQFAGIKYGKNEMSFRQTIPGKMGTDRGFRTVVDRVSRKVLISFDPTKVSPGHATWLASVEQRVGLGELDPQPYWGLDDLFHKAGTNLLNCFYVEAETKTEGGDEFFHYARILVLKGFSIDSFANALDTGDVLIDFDARTQHNHGTKFRIRQGTLPQLYSEITEV